MKNAEVHTTNNVGRFISVDGDINLELLGNEMGRYAQYLSVAHRNHCGGSLTVLTARETAPGVCD
jgi:hypothetical protein